MLKNIVRMPWYFIQLFTEAKSFKSNPIIGSKFLNRMGLHVIRVVSAHAIMKCRMVLLSRGVPKSLKEDYYNDGYMCISDVMSSEDFQKIYDETRAIRSEIRECIQGNTLTQRIHLDEDNRMQSHAIHRFLERKDIQKLLKFAAGKNHLPISHIQVIKSNYLNAENDPQKSLHSDTFHPTMKYWYFLQDVGENMAPFTYVKGSNKLTWSRLKWEYQRSISMDKEEVAYAKSGSFRVDESELEALGYPPSTAVYVPKNTLVIVNTFGFHRRGDTDKKHTRSEIWGISRTNPFNPFVGLDLKVFHRLDNWGLKQLRKMKDREAKKEGKVADWHVIESQDLYYDEV